MPSVPLRLRPGGDPSPVALALAAVRAELDVPGPFSPEVEAAARDAIATHRLPDLDLTELELVTIDPAGSRDLDQALAIERDGDGWIVHYAIADVASLVPAGGALDAEARRRGQTLYAPDARIPLYPVALSEGAGSLLPGVDRSALVWELRVESDGVTRAARVRRARVRSRRQWSYLDAQAAATTDATLRLLAEVGAAAQAAESARGGASLSTPEVEVVAEGDDVHLERRPALPIAGWNAQLSLLTGMAAARLMLDGGVGILRTMPPADGESIERFRRQTVALGVPWRDDERYGDYLRRLDGDDPAHLAIRHAATSLYRGAAYRAFDGEPPAESEQAAIGAPYAHATAPLRRLADRFALEVCVALSAGDPVPAEIRAALPELPAAMARSGSIAGRLDRRSLDTVEAAVLAHRVGVEFDAVALSSDHVQLADPAVDGPCDGPLEPGSRVRVRLTDADVTRGSVRFAPAGTG